jgi:hypothetical protein
MRWILITLLCVGSSAVKAASPEAVERTIAKAKAFIYKEQKPNGSWEESDKPDENSQPPYLTGGQFGGRTTICTYALLAAGESHQDPRLVKAIDWLKKLDARGTYVLGVRCNVWLLLPPTPELRTLMRNDLQKLLAAMKTQGEARGMFDYLNSGPGGTYSHSRSQYAVLGVWAAAQSGLEVPDSFWSIVEQGWLDHQDASGAWSYKKKPTEDYPLTPGMTAVGIATLFITQEYLHANEGVACKGNPRSEPIERALKWIGDNFDKFGEDRANHRDYPMAALYAMERIGVASGLKYFGKVDWYTKGSDWLISKQRPDGSWMESGPGSLVGTSFGVLFLARGRAPIAFNKLDFTSDPKKPALWNQRPRDAANISRWIGRQIERDLNWQIINLGSTLEDFHQAPIVYIAGSGAINLKKEEKDKLRQYVEQGGLIVGNADCSNSSFVAALRKLGGEMFDQYEFRELEAEHPIYTNQPFPRSKWKNKPMVLALGNGAREFMLIIPQADPARVWQLQNTGSKEELWQLGADIYLYAIDKKNARFRDVTHLVTRAESIQPNKQLSVARLKYDGNWNPEPAGWTRLATLMHNQNKVDLGTQTIEVGKQALEDIKVAHLTGTARFKFDEKQREAIKGFVQSGGTLIIDAAGGSSAFAESAETELNAMFADGLVPLPDSDPIYSRPDQKLEINYRDFARKVLGGLKDQGRLQVVRIGERNAVFYSREDLSVGLVGQPVDGIVGYDPPTATEIVRRILLPQIVDK